MHSAKKTNHIGNPEDQLLIAFKKKKKVRAHGENQRGGNGVNAAVNPVEDRV